MTHTHGGKSPSLTISAQPETTKPDLIYLGMIFDSVKICEWVRVGNLGNLWLKEERKIWEKDSVKINFSLFLTEGMKKLT